MKTSSRVGLAVLGLALASVSVAAHHSFAMFEMDKNVEYQGVVSEWKWQNPHVHFTVDIKPDVPEKLIKDYSDRLPN